MNRIHKDYIKTRALLLLFMAMLVTMSARSQSLYTLRDSLSQMIRMVDTYPDSLPLRFKKAAMNMRLEQWRYAQDEYTAILQRSPQNAEALYFRAYSYERQGHFGLAVADYEQLQRIVPGNLNVMMGLALVKNKQGRVTEAIDILNQAVRLFPDSAIALVARGNMEIERQQLEAAEYDFAQAVRLSPNDADTLLLHAEALIRLGRKREAVDALRRIEKLGISHTSLQEYYSRCR